MSTGWASRVTLAIAAVGVLAFVGISSVGIGPCSDDLAFEAPEMSADLSVEEDGSLSMTYHGETLRQPRTERLFVQITAQDSTDSESYPIAETDSEFPIRDGDSFVVLPAGDADEAFLETHTVAAIWQGSSEPLPAYCLDDRDDVTANTSFYRSEPN